MKLRTYLVEDNPTIRENLIATLEELADVEAVGIAETESAGTDWLQQNPDAWDLAIVDLFLRQGSGLGVLTACRERQPHQKIVVLSNYATPDIRSRCAQLGVDADDDVPLEAEHREVGHDHRAERPGLQHAVDPLAHGRFRDAEGPRDLDVGTPAVLLEQLHDVDVGLIKRKRHD